MAVLSCRVLPIPPVPRIVVWDPVDCATTPVRISGDVINVHVNGPRPGSTAIESTNYSEPHDTRNRAERRAAAAMGRKGRR